jgi:hypothetical protein
MAESGNEKLSLEEKTKIIQEAAEELNKLIDEEYYKIKMILENSPIPTYEDFTLTVGIQNAYLG